MSSDSHPQTSIRTGFRRRCAAELQSYPDFTARLSDVDPRRVGCGPTSQDRTLQGGFILIRAGWDVVRLHKTGLYKVDLYLSAPGGMWSDFTRQDFEVCKVELYTYCKIV